jgi:D-arabinose 1-dehydrogenase-like Zn-dependent alcohol dehydrogenase
MNMNNDTGTYRAVQAVAPGQLGLTTKPLREPPPGYVRIRVEACGVCHSDAATVAGMPHESLAFMFWGAGLFVFPLMLGYAAINYRVFRGKVLSTDNEY